MSRENIVLTNVDTTGFGLEIGPSYSPICPKKNGFKVHILDHCSKEDLIIKYKENQCLKDKIDEIENVDFIWRGEKYSDLIGKTEFYDYIIASHVIEHTVDILEFLAECSKLLKNNGILSLVIPDKRYIFDTFRGPTTIRDVIDKHDSNNHKSHSRGTLIDAYFNSVKCLDNENVFHIPVNYDVNWDKIKYNINLDDLNLISENYDVNQYKDCHSWVFTPTSFELLIYQLNKIKLLDLVLLSKTIFPGKSEFYIQLVKSKDEQGDGIDVQYLKNIYNNLLEENTFIYKNKYDLLEFANKNKKNYIYGAGKRARKILDLCMFIGIQIEGLIVSDFVEKDDLKFSKRIYHLKDVDVNQSIGILLGVSEQYIEEVVQNLKLNNITNYYYTYI